MINPFSLNLNSNLRRVQSSSTIAMTGSTQSLFLDPALRDWVLLPIFIVMIMVGILRHYATLLLQSSPKVESLKAVREQSTSVPYKTNQ